MKLVNNILLVTFVTLILGCGGGGGGGGGDSSGNACSVLNLKIFGGDSCNQKARSPVIAFFPVTSDGKQVSIAGICTASLVTLNDFVTSAHCFAEPIRLYGKKIVAFVVVAGGETGEGIRVSKYALHPRFDGKVGSPYDVAIGTLQRVPNPPIGPIPVEMGVATQVGDSVVSFGYGTNDVGEIGELKAASLSVEAESGGNIEATLESSGVSICPGDSGGPLVKQVNGVTSLVGVNSFGVSASGTEPCTNGEGSALSGFVNIQNSSIIDFLTRYAPDIAVR